MMVGTRDIINKAPVMDKRGKCQEERGSCGAGAERAKIVASAIQKRGDRGCLESG